MDYHLAGFPEHGNTKPILDSFKYSIRNNNRESCGIFVLDNFNFSFLPLENKFLKHRNYFLADSEIFSKHLINKKIFCLFHSHTIDSVEPSDLDIEVSQSLCLPSYIFSISSRDTCLYFPDSYNPPDLYGRQFISHLQDCVSFFKDFYFKKLNINLLNKYKDWGRKRLGSNEYLISNLELHFNEIQIKDIRYGDLIIFNPTITEFFHLGIYSENEKLAHHPYGMLSTEELITKETWNQVYKVYRYKEK
jgi:hypothetical protein